MAHEAPKHEDPAAVKATPSAAQNDIQTGEWKTHLFSCFEHIVPNCCMVWFCPCVSMAQISARLGVASYALVLVVFMLVYLAFLALNVFYALAVMADEDNSLVTIRSTSDGFTATAEVPALALPARITSFVYCFVLVGFTIFLRSTTRSRYQIPGNIVFDTLASLFCNCCAMAQIASHVKSYKKGSCSFGPLDTLPAYPQNSA